jgi:hypothetical protein
MAKKVNFDNYLKSHVELMKSFVSTSSPCNFIYKCFFTDGEINTTGMSIKEQWAFEIVMIRYTVCSIYHAGSYASMGVIFNETVDSYKPTYKGMQ